MLDIDRFDQEKESDQLQLPHLRHFHLQYEFFHVQQLSSPKIFSSKATSSGPWITVFTKEMEKLKLLRIITASVEYL